MLGEPVDKFSAAEEDIVLPVDCVREAGLPVKDDPFPVVVKLDDDVSELEVVLAGEVADDL
jgi:hypothetical protein